MAPALIVPAFDEAPLLLSKKNITQANDTKYEVAEDYHGGYQFAPIQEAQVSRTMIKRYVIRLTYWDA